MSFVALTIALASLKFYFLPRIDDFRVNIEQVVSSATKKSVRISQVIAGWDGIKPSVLLRGVQISEPSGVPLLQLEEVRARLSLLSFFKGEFSFSGLELEGPTIELSRDSDGRVWLASSLLYPSPEKSGDKLLDWVVRQESLKITGAQVTFKDALADDLVVKLDGVDITSSFFREKLTLKIFIRSESELLQTGSVVLDTLWPGSGHELSGVSGKVIFDLDGLNAEILSKYATIRDASLNGALSVNGSFEYSPSILKGLVEFNAKNLTTEMVTNGLSVSSITGIADFAKSSDLLSVDLSDISIRTEVGDVVGIDLVEINKSDDLVTGNLKAKNLNISAVKSLVGSLMEDDSSVNGAFSGLGSVGAIEYVDLEWRSEGEHFAIEKGLARAKNISYVSREGSRVMGYTGDLTLDGKSLKIVGRAEEFSLSSKLNFDEVVMLSDVKADMSVTLADDGLGIHLNDVSFKHEKAKGTAVGDIGLLAGEISHLGLSLTIDEFNLRDVHRFISNKSTATKSWMKSGLQVGMARNIKMELSGLPVDEDANQQLKIKTNINADIENGALQ
ncbi:MAG: AsmA family protein, partial [Burkholderiales bacterium]